MDTGKGIQDLGANQHTAVTIRGVLMTTNEHKKGGVHGVLAYKCPWPVLHGPISHYVDPCECKSTRIVTKGSPKPILEATGVLRKKSNFRKFSGATK